MNKLQRFFLQLFLVVGIAFGLAGCGRKPQPAPQPKGDANAVTIFALNDLHGAYEENERTVSLAQTIGYINDYRASAGEEGVVFVTGGDMLQGTALSNLSRGDMIFEVLAAAQLDAFVIGNHEFDWGREIMDEFVKRDPLPYKLLGANIVEKATGKLASFAEPYAVVQAGNYRVGIIGTIGVGLESSIAANMVAPFRFESEVAALEKWAPFLRRNKECDIVIWSSHSDTRAVHDTVAGFTGEARIDAIFNGHTHIEYSGEIRRPDGSILPFVQGGSSNKYLSRVKLWMDAAGKVETVTAENITLPRGQKADPETTAIIAKYEAQYGPQINRVLGRIDQTYSRPDVGYYIAREMKKAAGAQVGAINSGGVRDKFYAGEVTVSDVWTVMPFDNAIVKLTVKADGAGFATAIGILTGSCYVTEYEEGTLDGKNYFLIDGRRYFADDEIVIALVDFIYYRHQDSFDTAGSAELSSFVVRDVIIAAFEAQAAASGGTLSLRN